VRDRVLVVDDAANLRDLLTLLLELEDDFEVVGAAADGAQAIQRAALLHPDIVLLDLAMPVMDGLQALPQLRAQLPDATIVIFSGYEHESLAREALDAGADGYIEKGASVTHLVEQIRELRRGRRPDATGNGTMKA
jgi:DNA-binding NarL/FixJ family response regulator